MNNPYFYDGGVLPYFFSPLESRLGSYGPFARWPPLQPSFPLFRQPPFQYYYLPPPDSNDCNDATTSKKIVLNPPSEIDIQVAKIESPYPEIVLESLRPIFMDDCDVRPSVDYPQIPVLRVGDVDSDSPFNPGPPICYACGQLLRKRLTESIFNGKEACSKLTPGNFDIDITQRPLKKDSIISEINPSSTDSTTEIPLKQETLKEENEEETNNLAPAISTSKELQKKHTKDTAFEEESSSNIEAIKENGKQVIESKLKEEICEAKLEDQQVQITSEVANDTAPSAKKILNSSNSGKVNEKNKTASSIVSELKENLSKVKPTLYSEINLVGLLTRTFSETDSYIYENVIYSKKKTKMNGLEKESVKIDCSIILDENLCKAKNLEEGNPNYDMIQPNPNKELIKESSKDAVCKRNENLLSVSTNSSKELKTLIDASGQIDKQEEISCGTSPTIPVMVEGKNNIEPRKSNSEADKATRNLPKESASVQQISKDIETHKEYLLSNSQGDMPHSTSSAEDKTPISKLLSKSEKASTGLSESNLQQLGTSNADNGTSGDLLDSNAKKSVTTTSQDEKPFVATNQSEAQVSETSKPQTVETDLKHLGASKLNDDMTSTIQGAKARKSATPISEIENTAATQTEFNVNKSGTTKSQNEKTSVASPQSGTKQLEISKIQVEEIEKKQPETSKINLEENFEVHADSKAKKFENIESPKRKAFMTDPEFIVRQKAFYGTQKASIVIPEFKFKMPTSMTTKSESVTTPKSGSGSLRNCKKANIRAILSSHDILIPKQLCSYTQLPNSTYEMAIDNPFNVPDSKIENFVRGYFNNELEQGWKELICLGSAVSSLSDYMEETLQRIERGEYMLQESLYVDFVRWNRMSQDLHELLCTQVALMAIVNGSGVSNSRIKIYDILSASYIEWLKNAVIGIANRGISFGPVILPNELKDKIHNILMTEAFFPLDDSSEACIYFKEYVPPAFGQIAGLVSDCKSPMCRQIFEEHFLQKEDSILAWKPLGEGLYFKGYFVLIQLGQPKFPPQSLIARPGSHATLEYNSQNLSDLTFIREHHEDYYCMVCMTFQVTATHTQCAHCNLTLTE